MLTFTHLSGSTVRVTGASMPFVVFPQKTQAGDLHLHATAQENPSREHISWPGEYDVAGVTVRGVGQLEGQLVSYMVQADDVRCAFPASPLQEWTDHEIELLGDIHVLVLPAEDAKLCQKLLDDIDPRILIIVPAADGSVHQEVIKLCGATGKETVKEFKMKGALPQDGREVIVFG